jgi:hypothetical protein
MWHIGTIFQIEVPTQHTKYLLYDIIVWKEFPDVVKIIIQCTCISIYNGAHLYMSCQSGL